MSLVDLAIDDLRDPDAEHTLCVLATLYTPCRETILAAVEDADLFERRWRAILAGTRQGQFWDSTDPALFSDLHCWVADWRDVDVAIARVLDLARRRRVVRVAARLTEYAANMDRPLEPDAAVRAVVWAYQERAPTTVRTETPAVVVTATGPVLMPPVRSALDELDLSA